MQRAFKIKCKRQSFYQQFSHDTLKFIQSFILSTNYQPQSLQLYYDLVTLYTLYKQYYQCHVSHVKVVTKIASYLNLQSASLNQRIQKKLMLLKQIDITTHIKALQNFKFIIDKQQKYKLQKMSCKQQNDQQTIRCEYSFIKKINTDTNTSSEDQLYSWALKWDYSEQVELKNKQNLLELYKKKGFYLIFNKLLILNIIDIAQYLKIWYQLQDGSLSD